MNSRPMSLAAAAYELRFESLFQAGRGLTFPCDAQGSVRLDALSERARQNYLFARAVVGREYAAPTVWRCSAGRD
ncbi:MAG: hypothetical protein EKK53_06515 [Burkholderiales bacterium]|nr:MAG: hypothetical protein EKK53_06515 [Burkholderiales bacterium]